MVEKKEHKIIPNSSGYPIFENSGKLVHIWAAKNKYKNVDFTGKEVHHIDGNKWNWNNSNLLLVSKEDHNNIENYNRYLKTLKKIYFISGLLLFILMILIYKSPIFDNNYMKGLVILVYLLLTIAASMQKYKIRNLSKYFKWID